MQIRFIKKKERKKRSSVRYGGYAGSEGMRPNRLVLIAAGKKAFSDDLTGSSK